MAVMTAMAVMTVMTAMPMAVVAIVMMPMIVVMAAAPLMAAIPATAIPITVAMPAVMARRIHHVRRGCHIDRGRRRIDRRADLHAHVHMRHRRAGRQQGHCAREQRSKENRVSHGACFVVMGMGALYRAFLLPDAAECFGI